MQEHEKVMNECISYFRQSDIWNKVFTGFRNKFISYGKFSGKVILKSLSYEDIEELEGFFGKNFHGQKSVSISSEKFEKALKNSKYAEISPEELLNSYFDEILIGNAEKKLIVEKKVADIETEYCRNFKETPAGECLEIFEDILNRGGKSDLAEWKKLLWSCAKIYNSLPYRLEKKMYLAVYSAMLTGNPHAFDNGTKDGKILYQVIQKDLEKRNIKVEISDIFPAYKRQKSYLFAGIMIDDISNYALLYNVKAIKNSGEVHRGMEGFFQEKDVVQIPLAVISEWKSVECVDNEIYIVENPSVFAMMCGNKSCMCINGQPRLAGLLVLDLLAKSGTKVYYSGDIDPEGLLIAQKLCQYYKGDFEYWHMTEEDYYKCRSNEVLSEKRLKMLDKITDEKLVQTAGAVRRYGVAGYQEMLI